MNKITLVFALLAAFVVSTSVNAQDSEKKELPKFKKDSVSLWLSPSNQIHNIGFGEYKSEMQRMNEVADVVEPILKEHGVKVYRNDPEESIRDYTRRANELNVDLYFAIHSNAFNGKARGTVVFCHKKGGEGERFAKRINDALMEIYEGPNRGIQEGYKFYNGKPMWETSDSHMPACLVEVAFHDNEEDSKWILANIKPIGEALAKAVLEHLAAEHPDAVEK
ncbi:MAG: N-acetylmuramoyl-L-alanine amidase [Thermoguttaceae bacterium]|nr:N-acetylmuramoyl-L-alanine amidase [Thermoguttaceae bacterium]MBR4752513.1 N-acetylmuramoyl-L-alanine amidase [Thermoguttaceae bacterium]MBR5757926.1 N-acetylmuramoyl-L-alanine amidase [Thermoguttaceae bacterium]